MIGGHRPWLTVLSFEAMPTGLYPLPAEEERERNMKVNGKLMVGVMAIGGVIGGLAWGTPIVNLASPLFSTGTQNADIEARGEYEPTEFRAFLKTEGPSSTVLQYAAFSPGGHNGWHSHPGIVVVTLTTGSIEWYDVDCKKTV